MTPASTSSTYTLSKSEISTLIFDQYGTIVDMQLGLTEAVSPFLKDKDWSGDPHRFVTWWRRTHFENSMIDSLCDQGHTSYRQIGKNAVAFVMNRCNIIYSNEDVDWLVKQIELLAPFPDVLVALKKLRSAGYKLAILSNGDRDMLEAAKDYINFPFDFTISVQEAGYFKPHWKTYKAASDIIGEKRENCLFVANHTFDCVGAKAFGMKTVFINRKNRPFSISIHQPDLIVPDFSALSETLVTESEKLGDNYL